MRILPGASTKSTHLQIVRTNLAGKWRRLRRRSESAAAAVKDIVPRAARKRRGPGTKPFARNNAGPNDAREELGDASPHETQEKLCESIETCDINDLVALVDGEVKNKKNRKGEMRNNHEKKAQEDETTKRHMTSRSSTDKGSVSQGVGGLEACKSCKHATTTMP